MQPDSTINTKCPSLSRAASFGPRSSWLTPQPIWSTMKLGPSCGLSPLSPCSKLQFARTPPQPLATLPRRRIATRYWISKSVAPLPSTLRHPDQCIGFTFQPISFESPSEPAQTIVLVEELISLIEWKYGAAAGVIRSYAFQSLGCIFWSSTDMAFWSRTLLHMRSGPSG